MSRYKLTITIEDNTLRGVLLLMKVVRNMFSNPMDLLGNYPGEGKAGLRRTHEDGSITLEIDEISRATA